MTAKPSLDAPVRLFKTQDAWEAWLEKNAQSAPGLWMRLAKKASKLQSIDYQQALESALCYGWIDGLKKSYDEDSWIQKFTPRRKRSLWSKINRAKALELIAQGRMREAGHAAIEQAKQNGQWEAAYDSHRTIEVPADLEAELKKSRRARETFDSLQRSHRFAVLIRLQLAKKEETRKRRLALFMEKLKRGESPFS